MLKKMLCVLMLAVGAGACAVDAQIDDEGVSADADALASDETEGAAELALEADYRGCPVLPGARAGLCDDHCRSRGYRSGYCGGPWYRPGTVCTCRR
ncbi:hypothetical protein [Polyangium spumosum]|uniref:Invertebrate defensins family profile domain-containing protein n=1 Tax=Polyangium spumosum TaxID=889282 RepID=A0A6N7Q3F8_9BACT|nr:hypothetical protein [Polyangium spumosum]MRG97155.1 hypothetical protein [Polyangium spumosum]